MLHFPLSSKFLLAQHRAQHRIGSNQDDNMSLLSSRWKNPNQNDESSYRVKCESAAPMLSTQNHNTLRLPALYVTSIMSNLSTTSSHMNPLLNMASGIGMSKNYSAWYGVSVPLVKMVSHFSPFIPSFHLLTHCTRRYRPPLPRKPTRSVNRQ